LIDDCLQLFGGCGYMNEYLIRRAGRAQRIGDDFNEIVRGRVSRGLK
jgi:hypothetical protein